MWTCIRGAVLGSVHLSGEMGNNCPPGSMVKDGGGVGDVGRWWERQAGGLGNVGHMDVVVRSLGGGRVRD